MIFNYFLAICPTSSDFINTLIQVVLFEGAIFLLIPVFGMLVEGIIVRGLRGILSKFLGPLEIVFSDYLLFLGVVIHELSHAIVAFITGAKITEVALFKPENGSLGHVTFEARGNAFFKALQRSLSSCAPVVVGTLIISLLYFKAIPVISTTFQWVITIYLLVSVLFHMNMSGADLKCYFKGAGPILLIAFPIYLIIFFTR